MIEFYSDWAIFLKIGPYILATYGLFVGVMGFVQFYLGMLYIGLLESTGYLSMPPTFKAPLGVAAIFMVMLGYRLCSMYLEDKHELANGNYLRALLRPGFLEAGGHTFLVIFSFASGLYVSLASSPSLVSAVLVVDAMNVGYYGGFCFLSLGCVTYGCCWGKEVPEGTWYATKYTNPAAKILRLRPELKGKPLFPHTTLRGVLFLKNALILIALGHIFYVPGLFTVIAPILNRWDKNIYYTKRGDAGADLVGFCKEENFYMIGPAEKKAHCVAWAKPDQFFGYVAMATAAYWIVTGQGNLPLVPGLAELANVTTLPNFASGMWASFAISCLSFGFHYKSMGCWLTPPDYTKKA